MLTRLLFSKFHSPRRRSAHWSHSRILPPLSMTYYEVEMDDLRNKKKSTSTPGGDLPVPQIGSQDSTQQIWALSVAGMSVAFHVHLLKLKLTICNSLAILSVPLLFFPRFLLFLSSAAEPAVLTPLERFLCYQLGILILGMAAGVVVAVRI
jgi:hypothetical protein